MVKYSLERQQSMEHRLKPLHNFDLPNKWGHQKLLRCIKVIHPHPDHDDVAPVNNNEIEATRKKLMLDLGKIKDAMFKQRFIHPIMTSSPANVTSSSSSPWNLRTRRAVCKAPRSPVNGVNEVNGEKKRERFSVALSRREVEDDFMKMTGRRLPRKPKRRPRAVQKQLDTLFPGLWLTEITPDLYKVPDEIETGKR